MRRLMMLAPLLLASCGEGEGVVENKAEAAKGLSAGQWEVTSEVTAFRAADEGAPKIDTPAGTTATESICVPEGERPPTQIFSGEGYDCQYSNYYARRGRMNITMNCSREGMSGNIAMAVDGKFDAESFEVSREVTTYFTTDGDVQATATVTGRRTGECAPQDEGAEAEAGAAQ